MTLGGGPLGGNLVKRVEPSWMALVPLWEVPCPLQSCDNIDRRCCPWTWKCALTRHQIYWYFDLGLPVSRSVRNKSFYCLRHLVYGNLLWHLAETKTTYTPHHVCQSWGPLKHTALLTCFRGQVGGSCLLPGSGYLSFPGLASSQRMHELLCEGGLYWNTDEKSCLNAHQEGHFRLLSSCCSLSPHLFGFE